MKPKDLRVLFTRAADALRRPEDMLPEDLRHLREDLAEATAYYAEPAPSYSGPPPKLKKGQALVYIIPDCLYRPEQCRKCNHPVLQPYRQENRGCGWACSACNEFHRRVPTMEYTLYQTMSATDEVKPIGSYRTRVDDFSTAEARLRKQYDIRPSDRYYFVRGESIPVDQEIPPA